MSINWYNKTDSRKFQINWVYLHILVYTTHSFSLSLFKHMRTRERELTHTFSSLSLSGFGFPDFSGYGDTVLCSSVHLVGVPGSVALAVSCARSRCAERNAPGDLLDGFPVEEYEPLDCLPSICTLRY